MSKQMEIEQWESAWAEYISALDFSDRIPSGEDFVYWCGVAGRRLTEAKCQLRHIDPEFCQSLGI